MKKLDIFKMPKSVTISARTSSITNAFVSGIIPTKNPTEKEIEEVLNVLGMDSKSIKCAYCGDKHTEWDHFKPLIKDKKPTGYISEIYNLVPCCGKCNQSKGNRNWEEWINSSASLSPKSKRIKNLNQIIERLKTFESNFTRTRIEFEKAVDKKIWTDYWKNCDNLHKKLKETQIISNEIKNILKNQQL